MVIVIWFTPCTNSMRSITKLNQTLHTWNQSSKQSYAQYIYKIANRVHKSLTMSAMEIYLGIHNFLLTMNYHHQFPLSWDIFQWNQQPILFPVNVCLYNFFHRKFFLSNIPLLWLASPPTQGFEKNNFFFFLLKPTFLSCGALFHPYITYFSR